MSLVGPSAGDIRHEDTFTIGDGINKQTYQFLDTAISTNTLYIPIYFSGRETSAQMAQRIVTAINTDTTGLKVTASAISTGGLGAGLGSNRVNLFGATFVRGIEYYVYGENFLLYSDPSAPPANNRQPSVSSPDEKKIVFVSNLRDPNNPNVNNPNGYQQIFVMNADGTGVTQITSNNSGSVNYSRPSYGNLPGYGDFVLFSSNASGNYDIQVLAPDGSVPTWWSQLLTALGLPGPFGPGITLNSASDDLEPQFGYEGANLGLVFSSNRGGAGYRI